MEKRMDKISVPELRKFVTENCGVDKEDAATMKRAELEKIKDNEVISSEYSVLDEAMANLNGEDIEENEKRSIYLQEDIMAMFKKDELIDGAPKANGLRRVAQEVIGNITNQEVTIAPLCIRNVNEGVDGVMATFKVSILCENEHFGEVGSIITFADAADCLPFMNTGSDDYAKYPTAIAATRAEVRTYRKMLRLNIVAADEIGDNEPLVKSTNSSQHTDGSITEAQKKALTIACANKKINIDEVLANCSRDVSSIDELIQDDFHKFIKWVAEQKPKKETK